MFDEDPRGVNQTRYGDPYTSPPEERGNCMQASVATYFGLQLSEVPSFTDYIVLKTDGGDDSGWWAKMQDFFAGRALHLERVRTNEAPPFRCLVAGSVKNPRGQIFKHMVVGDQGRIVWDPHPRRLGLSEIEEIWVPTKAA